MKFHIIQMGETIDEIIFLYNLTKDELKEENRHIRKWDKLIPGTKLKIPVITETIDSEVSEMEPFIEDYYPKLNIEEDLKTNSSDEEELAEVFKEENDEKEIIEENKEIEIHEELEKETEELMPKKTTEEIEKKEIVKQKNNKVNYPYFNPYYPYYYYSNIRVPYPIYYYPIYYRKK